MNETTSPPMEQPVDLFAPYLERYEALAELIGPTTPTSAILALLEGINEGFRAQCDRNMT